MGFGVQLTFSFFFFIKSGAPAWGMVAPPLISRVDILASVRPLQKCPQTHTEVYCLENPKSYQSDGEN